MKIVIFSIVVLNCLLALVAGQTVPNPCSTGSYTGYASTEYFNRQFPVNVLNGRNYNSGGFYFASSAEQCCYNCITQTGGACTTWTFDGCPTRTNSGTWAGKCYLSSARLSYYAN